MANLKLRQVDSVPAALEYRSIIIVGTGEALQLYIGDATNKPTAISPEQANFNNYLLGKVDFDESQEMGFNLDESKLNITIKEN